MESDFQRIVIVGTSCSGKTKLAKQLAERIGLPHVELDALHWGPSWTPNPPETFHASVAEAVAAQQWVIDGNYSSVQPLVWSQADTLIWLNYRFSLVFSRTLRRTISRAWNKTELFSGNRESFRMSFFSRDSLLLWIIKTHGRYRRDYAQRLASEECAHLRVIELRGKKETAKFVEELAKPNAAE